MARRRDDVIYIKQRLANGIAGLIRIAGHLPGDDPQGRIGSDHAATFETVKITCTGGIHLIRLLMRPLFPVHDLEFELLVLVRRGKSGLDPHIDPAFVIGGLRRSRQVHSQPPAEPA